MNSPRVPPRFVPTLTEVVEFDEAQVLDGPLVVQVEPISLEPAFAPEPVPAVAIAHAPVLAPVSAAAYDSASAPLEQSVADVAGDGEMDASSVAQAQVVAHPEAVGATGATEDVPAFLLATQPVPTWSPPTVAAPSAPAIPEREPVLSAIVSKPMVATEPIAEPVAHPAVAGGMLDAGREEQIVQSVLTELQRRSDLMLEYRLRETLTPILARLCDTLIKEAREDLAVTLRDVVSRAVSQELARHRPK